MCVDAEKLADVEGVSGDIPSRLLKGQLIFSMPSAEVEGVREHMEQKEQGWHQRAQA